MITPPEDWQLSPLPEEAYRDAAVEVTEARVRYAREFQLAKMRAVGITDGHAHQIAIEETKSELTLLEAELVLAERRLI